jgi:Malectin domain
MCLPAAAQTQQAIRVNCGGGGYTDSSGRVWQADTGYNTGTASTNTASTTGTSDPALSRSNRFNRDSIPMIYAFAVANGNYRVNLLFAENSTAVQSVGGRVFNVQLNNQPVLQNFDIFATVGANAAVVESFNTSLSNGKMAIQFDRVVENPKINAIEIMPLGSAPLLTLKFSYPDGTPVVGLAALRDVHFPALHRRQSAARERAGQLRPGFFADRSGPGGPDPGVPEPD